MADLVDLGVAWLLGLSALVAAGVAAERALPAAGIIWRGS